MTPENKILRDLQAGRTTAAAIGSRIEMHPQAVAVILERMERDNLVTSKQHGPLTIYTIVPKNP
jgi:predicted transcriptional regulator